MDASTSQLTSTPATGVRFTVSMAGLMADIYTLRLQAGTATLIKRVVVQ